MLPERCDRGTDDGEAREHRQWDPAEHEHGGGDGAEHRGRREVGLGDEALVCVRDGGSFITALPSSVPGTQRGIYPNSVQVQPDGPSLAQLATQVVEGNLSPRVARTLAIADFKEGYELVAKGGVGGKVVFTL